MGTDSRISPITDRVDTQMPIKCWYYPRMLEWGWMPECTDQQLMGASQGLAQGYQSLSELSMAR